MMQERQRSKGMEDNSSDFGDGKLDFVSKLILVLSFMVVFGLIGFIFLRSKAFVISFFVGLGGLFLIGVIGSFKDL